MADFWEMAENVRWPKSENGRKCQMADFWEMAENGKWPIFSRWLIFVRMADFYWMADFWQMVYFVKSHFSKLLKFKPPQFL
jgi:hypothetical protein